MRVRLEASIGARKVPALAISPFRMGQYPAFFQESGHFNAAELCRLFSFFFSSNLEAWVWLLLLLPLLKATLRPLLWVKESIKNCAYVVAMSHKFLSKRNLPVHSPENKSQVLRAGEKNLFVNFESSAAPRFAMLRAE